MVQSNLMMGNMNMGVMQNNQAAMNLLAMQQQQQQALLIQQNQLKLNQMGLNTGLAGQANLAGQTTSFGTSNTVSYNAPQTAQPTAAPTGAGATQPNLMEFNLLSN
jgi:hypothetical protein